MPFVTNMYKIIGEEEFKKMKTDGMLVKDANGVAFRKWQYGEDAVLDMSNPLTQQWLSYMKTTAFLYLQENSLIKYAQCSLQSTETEFLIFCKNS